MCVDTVEYLAGPAANLYFVCSSSSPLHVAAFQTMAEEYREYLFEPPPLFLLVALLLSLRQLGNMSWILFPHVALRNSGFCVLHPLKVCPLDWVMGHRVYWNILHRWVAQIGHQVKLLQ